MWSRDGRNTRSAAAHGALHDIVVGGVVAGVAAAVVIILSRLAVGIAVFLAVLYQTRSWHGYVTGLFRRAVWTTVKVAARPFVGDRVFEPGFDLPIVALGIASLFGFSILTGLVFAALAHGRSRGFTFALGILFGIGVFFLDLHLINPAPATAVEIIPSGFAMAYAFLWYEDRLPAPG